jgi:hypothetical protein
MDSLHVRRNHEILNTMITTKARRNTVEQRCRQKKVKDGLTPVVVAG